MVSVGAGYRPSQMEHSVIIVELACETQVTENH